MRFDLAYNLNYAVKKPTAIELERFTEFHHQDMLLNFVRKTKGEGHRSAHRPELRTERLFGQA
ncbi:MAG: hypothetical protein ACLPN1_10255, partial [Dissulfurispiraceae bacterium]